MIHENFTFTLWINCNEYNVQLISFIQSNSNEYLKENFQYQSTSLLLRLDIDLNLFTNSDTFFRIKLKIFINNRFDSAQNFTPPSIYIFINTVAQFGRTLCIGTLLWGDSRDERRVPGEQVLYRNHKAAKQKRVGRWCIVALLLLQK